MRINPQAIERLESAPITGKGLATILREAFAVIDKSDIISFYLDYQSPEDTVERDDLIPFVTLSLRPATV